MSTRIVQNTLYPFYVGRTATYHSHNPIQVVDKYTQQVVCSVSAAPSEAIKEAIGKASDAQEAMKNMPNYARKDILLWLADKLQKNIEGLADLLVLEVGKTITDAKGEVSRAIDTFTLSAEESVRKEGHFMDLDYSPRGSGYSCLVRRFPVGLVSMITPFNFPINLAAHKIGPAIASGCPFVLKPSDRTPLSAIILGQYLSETNLPDGAFSILPCHLQDAHLLSTDERIRLLSFTGSARVGWQLRKNSGKMKISLELGGNASCILTETADIGVAVDRLIFGSFYANGQSCISVQRIHVHESIIDTFLPLFIEKAKKLKTGDPYLVCLIYFF
eukprot:TRINITY_DN8254_c0_g4_i7.p1 TRINITY_DN8254_c0_g4~~TRINITY_DN8254_c0_g4_i7.p1  ORF type:complete len:331 (-),score=37.68 TRINITY_DN8254_c0_g4_i7:513-1505(-)